jgi:hypothetical protein
MRVLTDADGYVTLRLCEFPNTAFDIETEHYQNADDEDFDPYLPLACVTLEAVPVADPKAEYEPPSPAMDELNKTLEGLVGRENLLLGQMLNELERQADVAVAEAARQARLDAITAKFGRGGGTGVPKAG